MQLVMQRLGPLPPEGTKHLARLIRIEGLDEPLVLRHGQCLKLVFGFLESTYQRREATALTSTAVNEHSRIYRLARSMTAREFDDGEEIAEELRRQLNNVFWIQVQHREGETGDVKFLDVLTAEPGPG